MGSAFGRWEFDLLEVIWRVPELPPTTDDEIELRTSPRISEEIAQVILFQQIVGIEEKHPLTRSGIQTMVARRSGAGDRCWCAEQPNAAVTKSEALDSLRAIVI